MLVLNRRRDDVILPPHTLLTPQAVKGLLTGGADPRCG
jgi:hypothetical protein